MLRKKIEISLVVEDNIIKFEWYLKFTFCLSVLYKFRLFFRFHRNFPCVTSWKEGRGFAKWDINVTRRGVGLKKEFWVTSFMSDSLTSPIFKCIFLAYIIHGEHWLCKGSLDHPYLFKSYNEQVKYIRIIKTITTTS